MAVLSVYRMCLVVRKVSIRLIMDVWLAPWACRSFCNILCRHALPRGHGGKDGDNHFAYYPDELRFMDFLVSNFLVRDVRLFGSNVPDLCKGDSVVGLGRM